MTQNLLRLFTLFIGCIFFSTAQGQEADSEQDEIPDMFELTLEELMNIEVTSVSKRAQRRQDVASAIYVITQDEIRRSGATRLEDLLQMMVPGTFFQSNSYTESEFGLRDNTNPFLGSVLVLIDNVPYQSPLTSAFNFTNFDLSFDEIDRIEIIRGPGGTIYGANAATGVINIFTKNPESQQGWAASYKQGTRGFVSPSVRYATSVSANSHIKLFAKGNFFDGFKPLDEFSGSHVTVPVTDIDPNTGLGLGTSSGTTTIVNNLEGDVYKTNKIMTGLNLQSTLSDDMQLKADFYYFNHRRNIYSSSLRPSPVAYFALDEQNNSRIVSSVRLDKSFNNDHDIFVQFSGNKETVNGTVEDYSVSTLNLEIQDNLTLGINRISTGFNLRSVDFRVGPYGEGSGIDYTDANATEYLWGLFIQDQILFGDKFNMTLGVKAETWSLIDNKPEFSPSARFAYMPTEKLTIWGAGSRSVTTPGFIHTNIELTFAEVMPPFLPYRIALINADTDQSEYLTAELGVRASVDKFSVDVSGFYAKSDKLLDVTDGGTEPVESPVNPSEMIIPLVYANIYEADNYGVESIVKFFPSEKMRFELSHSWFITERKGKNNPITGDKVEYIKPENPSMPEHVVRLRSYFTLPSDIEFSVSSLYNTITGSNRFFYDQQRFSGVEGDLGYTLDEPQDRVRVDFKVEKFFNNRKTSVFIWGNDIFNDGTVMHYNPFTTGIPMQVHRIVGAGASIKL
ncbi:hypothetical protein GCM10009122_44040 [Fulvivirga kasyanovii]|uniref:TonB-dependent receptor n=1 Tax=Fulvivirga kasyanovii TaxID=396812 RepID=A0ABW9RNK6_9BACT|nr:TonB-dependent receptor [Fulvivirga kasyanovii]MTI25576.1 hypothetical protein [Fulvivirga kasyanovii]